MKTSIALLMGGSVLALGLSGAMAQDYPTKPIEIIVPYNAGGGTDLSARITAEILQKHLPGSTVIVVNQPGGGGGIGTNAILNAAPDGYTLGTGSQGPLSVLTHLGAVPYTIDDVGFLALMGRNLQVMLACANAPFATFEEFVSHAQDNPRGVSVGNTGAGGAIHVSIEAFGVEAGLEFESIPFSGASEALTICAGGHIDATVATPAEALPHVQSGSMTPLFIMEDERIDEFPDTPTAVEMGIDFTWSSWKGIIAPQGLPDDVRSTLEEALEATFNDPDFIARMQDMGEFVDYRDAEGYEALAREDSDIAEQIIRDLGMYGMNAP